MQTSYLTNDIEDQNIHNEADLETLKSGLNFLFNRYLEHQSKATASKIVQQLVMILKHDSGADFSADRCTFYRLIQHWRAKCI